IVLAETRERDEAKHAELKSRINELALGLIGAPVDDIVLAPPHTVPKTSSGKIRRVAAREYYERGPDAVKPQAVWLQFVRLVAAGVMPQLRRGLRVVRGLLFAGYAWVLFGLLFFALFIVAALAQAAPPGASASAARASSCGSAPSPWWCAGARTCPRAARTWWRAITRATSTARCCLPSCRGTRAPSSPSASCASSSLRESSSAAWARGSSSASMCRRAPSTPTSS